MGDLLGHFTGEFPVVRRRGELDCAFESICENCAFFQTSIEFRPTLQAQHDHAAAQGQTHRAELFNRLIHRVDHQEAS